MFLIAETGNWIWNLGGRPRKYNQPSEEFLSLMLHLTIFLKSESD